MYFIYLKSAVASRLMTVLFILAALSSALRKVYVTNFDTNN
jgi:hypothetical protein